MFKFPRISAARGSEATLDVSDLTPEERRDVASYAQSYRRLRTTPGQVKTLAELWEEISAVPSDFSDEEAMEIALNAVADTRREAREKAAQRGV